MTKTITRTIAIWGDGQVSHTRFARLLDKIDAGELAGDVDRDPSFSVDYALAHGAPEAHWTEQWCLTVTATEDVLECVETAADSAPGVRAYGTVR